MQQPMSGQPQPLGGIGGYANLESAMQPNMSRPVSFDKIHPDFKTGQPLEELKAADPNSTLMGQQGPSVPTAIEGKFKVGDIFSTMPPTTELGSKNVQQHSTDPQYQQMLAWSQRGGQPAGGMQSQGPRVLGIGGPQLATGGIANHFRKK